MFVRFSAIVIGCNYKFQNGCDARHDIQTEQWITNINDIEVNDKWIRTLYKLS